MVLVGLSGTRVARSNCGLIDRVLSTAVRNSRRLELRRDLGEACEATEPSSENSIPEANSLRTGSCRGSIAAPFLGVGSCRGSPFGSGEGGLLSFDLIETSS